MSEFEEAKKNDGQDSAKPDNDDGKQVENSGSKDDVKVRALWFYEEKHGSKALAEPKDHADPKDDDSKNSKDGDDSKKDKDGKDQDGDQKPKKSPVYKRPGFIIGAIIAVILITIVVIVIWLIERQYVTTDDGYIDGHIVQISPQVNARVLELHIDDNQFVHKGDLLVQLDPTDFQVALEQAKAQVASAIGRLAQARAQIESSQAAVAQAVAREHSAQASFENTVRDLERYQKVDERARSRQQLDTAATSQTNASADVEQAHAQVVAAQANVTTSEAAVTAAEGEVQTAKAQQRQAEVNLSYCQVVAPMDGRITERTVESGNYATAGTVLCMLVDPDVWVTANLKETQLNLVRQGQGVTIKVDAFPGRKFQGHVDSIQAGTGARFSVLPAENATGNYVKIVQRVPVKILFDHDANTNDAPMLSPGLSVVPRIKVR